MLARWYQVEAREGFFQFCRDKQNWNPIPCPLILMPTGTGKSFVIADIVQHIFKGRRNVRALMATHVKELVVQNFKKLKAVWPTAPAGIVSAGLKLKEYGRPITYAGIASLKSALPMLGKIDIMFIDEAHLLNPKETTMYAKLIKHLRTLNPRLVVVGLSATGWRTKGGRLEELENAIFNGVAYDATTPEHWVRFIEEGVLSPLVVTKTKVELKYENVATGQDGDFVLGQLQKAVDDYATTRAAITELLAAAEAHDEYEDDDGNLIPAEPYRQCGLIFGAGIEHATHIWQELRSRGETAVLVHSKMSDEARDKAIADWQAGKHRWAVNNGIMTTGLDQPPLDVIGGMRPSKSSSLHVQMLGRGTRPWDGIDPETGAPHAVFWREKINCLVMDFARNTRRLGPVDDPVIPGDKKSMKRPLKAGQAVVRTCPICEKYSAARALVCSHCGYEFPWVEPKIEETAGTDLPMKLDGKGRKRKVVEEPQTAWFNVDHVTYRYNRGFGDKPGTMLINYHCGLRTFNQWLCFDHHGGPRGIACDWWQHHANNPFPPATVAEALQRTDELTAPARILVWHNRKPHPQVKNYEYREREEA